MPTGTSAQTQRNAWLTSYPNLQRFAVDLTKLARLGKIQAVAGYDNEIDASSKRWPVSKTTPVLVGDSNLDRSSIARGSGTQDRLRKCPWLSCGKNKFSVSVSTRLPPRRKTSQEFESRVQAIISETEKANGQIILFIDELQEFAGKRATYVASTALKNALREKCLRVIGAASPASYDQYIAADESLAGCLNQS